MGRGLKGTLLVATALLTAGCSLKTTKTSSQASTDSAAVLAGIRSAVTGSNAPNQPLPPSSGSADYRPYFPLAPGFYWNYVNTQTQAPLKISVGGSPAYFGSSAQYMAVGPFDVTFEKRDAANYWNPGATWNLHWYLGYDPNGVLISSATSLWDYTTGLTVGDTWDLYSLTPNMPPYYLVPSDPSVTQVNNLHQYVMRAGVTPQPLTVGPSGTSADGKTISTTNTWKVSWAPDVVSVPAYSGPVLRATYGETDPNDPNGGQLEDWYYARGVGVVKIIAYRDVGVTFNPPIEVDLQDYSLVPQSLVPAPISFRDRLASATGTWGTSTDPTNRYYGLTYDGWNAASAGIGTTGPTDAAACITTANANNIIDIDTYLSLVAAAGTCASNTPPPPPPPPSCLLLINGSTSASYTVGGNSEVYSIYCNQPNLTFDWHGTKDGATDILSPAPVNYFPAGRVYSAPGANGVTIIYPPFTTGQESFNPYYTRYVDIRDAQGNPILDTSGNPLVSNVIDIQVLPQPQTATPLSLGSIGITCNVGGVSYPEYYRVANAPFVCAATFQITGAQSCVYGPNMDPVTLSGTTGVYNYSGNYGPTLDAYSGSAVLTCTGATGTLSRSYTATCTAGSATCQFN